MSNNLVLLNKLQQDFEVQLKSSKFTEDQNLLDEISTIPDLLERHT